ncbi:putative 30S ribosomal subunit protein S6 [Candidatus Zinderia insecticola CARI]|uniref:Small ribosomal subunit protein bS6 n=1 Tax=Zinderia insecticola (strain CARI) TaxID=871271 RepID=E0TIW5_ZINIC|nr:putative 30S ribosomal subunit protein S6 [Candidatus Zinderia insecticola CARI]
MKKKYEIILLSKYKDNKKIKKIILYYINYLYNIGGKILYVKKLGYKILSYKIKKKKNAYYLCFYILLNPEFLNI